MQWPQFVIGSTYDAVPFCINARKKSGNKAFAGIFKGTACILQYTILKTFSN